MKKRIAFFPMMSIIFILSLIIVGCSMNVKSNPAGRYVSNNGSWIVITEANTWYGTIYEKSIATGIDWEYSYGGKINNNNELVITKGETRRVLPGGAIVDGGNVFGELIGDEIHSGGLMFKKDEGSLELLQKNGGDFITTNRGVKYQFVTSNPNTQQVQVGDVLVGTMRVSFNGEVTYDNVDPKQLLIAGDSEEIYFNDVLLMMHIGDKVIIKVPADSIFKMVLPNQIPDSYEPGKGMMIEYRISLQSIISKNSYSKENERKLEEAKANEFETLSNYIKKNNIKVTPTASGLYIIVKKKGKGKIVKDGSTVTVDYIGRLFNGTVFDCSREDDAKKSGIYSSNQRYEPLIYTVGNTKMINGWEEGIMDQHAGSEIMLIIPSSLAYGARGAGSTIPPYTPLIFDITIRSVE